MQGRLVLEICEIVGWIQAAQTSPSKTLLLLHLENIPYSQATGSKPKKQIFFHQASQILIYIIFKIRAHKFKLGLFNLPSMKGRLYTNIILYLNPWLQYFKIQNFSCSSKYYFVIYQLSLNLNYQGKYVCQCLCLRFYNCKSSSL